MCVMQWIFFNMQGYLMHQCLVSWHHQCISSSAGGCITKSWSDASYWLDAPDQLSTALVRVRNISAFLSKTFYCWDRSLAIDTLSLISGSAFHHFSLFTTFNHISRIFTTFHHSGSAFLTLSTAGIDHLLLTLYHWSVGRHFTHGEAWSVSWCKNIK